ncbi:MAG: ABC transporter permease [Bacteroidales bacterium]
MIKNYLRTATRNILRNKKISIINIVGLSLSMSVCMLIIVIIQDQYSYDNFIEKRGELYRIQTIDNLSKYSFNKFASTNYPLAKELRDKYSYGSQIIALNNSFGGDAEYGDIKIPISGLYAEPGFFSMFSFNLVEGSAVNALSEPWSIVLTRDVAERYFGSEEPLGKTLVIEGMGNFNVTGVVDMGKNKSHIQFESLVSSSTMESLQPGTAGRRMVTDWKDFNSSYIYIRLDDPSLVGTVEQALRKISEEKYADDEKTDVTFYLFPFNSIVPGPILGNELGMSMPRIYLLLFGGLGLVIIFSAAFNYTSLSIARSMTRVKEFGVRKTLGASRREITLMIYSEAIIISVISMLVGIIILQFLLPAFKGMQMMSLLEIDPSQNITVFAWFLLFAVFTGIVAGSLPAVYISRITPVLVLQGSSSIKIFKRLTFRKILLVSQYFFSVVFIITVILIFRQMNYMVKADMGFDRAMVFNMRSRKMIINLWQTVSQGWRELFPLRGSPMFRGWQPP